MAKQNSKGMLPNGRKAHNKSFAGIPRNVMNSDNYKGLSANAVRTLLELCRVYYGKNNGNLSAAWSDMEKRGYKSKGTLYRSLKELEDANLILKTREGAFSGRGEKSQCALYALTWEAIDESYGKHDVLSTQKPVKGF